MLCFLRCDVSQVRVVLVPAFQGLVQCSCRSQAGALDTSFVELERISYCRFRAFSFAGNDNRLNAGRGSSLQETLRSFLCGEVQPAVEGSSRFWSVFGVRCRGNAAVRGGRSVNLGVEAAPRKFDQMPSTLSRVHWDSLDRDGLQVDRRRDGLISLVAICCAD